MVVVVVGGLVVAEDRARRAPDGVGEVRGGRRGLDEALEGAEEVGGAVGARAEVG